ncbi:MAG TPA: hypothetical protein VM934_14710 [Pyrinomonadaceae bacterium]|nr:hypothetical protein [Pyrinomonadaceae bacterium]
MHTKPHRHGSSSFYGALVLMLLVFTGSAHAQKATAIAQPAPEPMPPQPATIEYACERIIKADVVALDQVITYNRLGAVNPAGMMFALRRDVKPSNSGKIAYASPSPTSSDAMASDQPVYYTEPSGTDLMPGQVQLKDYKRPRPLVLRMNAGDCLQISFQNLLDPGRADDNQPATRTASIHVAGLQLVNSILDDGSNVGRDGQNGLVAPGGSAVYTLYAEREGQHLLYSTAATTGGEGDGGSLSMGLFGSVNVEPRNSQWFRSQVTARELELATKKDAYGTPMTTGGRHPVIDYNALYPYGESRPEKSPILRILDGNNEIVHSDLNAIITGSDPSDASLKGRFPAGTYRPNATEPDRDQPFREFTVVYHDEIKAVQAFPQFDDKIDGRENPLAHTLHSVRDGFAINYGTGGIGAEILANRFGVGPMANCNDCLYEEFFLSAWAIGDPAQLVDVPANAKDGNGNLRLGPKANKVLFPDDPSNVHHSYLNDHVKMRVSHAGPKEHHIHHLHAHQWLHSPDNDNSSYLDSQAFGPGYSFVTEIAHGGSGNKNKTAGDSIFHCHFYPHFAQGMWELWRTHDAFEAGTQVDGNGIPTATARKLPDGEIAAGTPIPALVPLPGLALAPMPNAKFQGYPFYIPGVAGHRPPHPPLDSEFDGGLPRHVIVGGQVAHHKEQLPAFDLNRARLDFDKTLITVQANAVPEAGTFAEQTAMAFHAARTHASFTSDGSTTLPGGAPAQFITNGKPGVKGAPFADPCVDDNGVAVGTPRVYKSANIQLDLKLNKAGWHFQQSRISVLWEDVAATRNGTRPPEPLFFRANTNDCITFHHTNLVPRVYAQDDFQVRTPTDIMGQHIHLVKFDVTASDGAGNGWNYEDGTFSPEEVVERIHAIRKFNGCLGEDKGDTRDGTFTCPVAQPHPFFGVLGAQTTIQRWFVDDVLNNGRVDRTLRTVFTHDHFGPSTHQQAGLYAGLVVEPAGSTWRTPETGVIFGGDGIVPRKDGGPTSWKADIITKDASQSYREFLLEFSDFQLAYTADGRPVNPPAKDEVGLPYLVRPATICPGDAPLPCPEAVSAADVGTMSVNYRNEPTPHRIWNHNGSGAEPGPGSFPQQTAGDAGDLSNVYRSDILRTDVRYNSQPGFYPPLTPDVRPGDPFTPLLRAYEDDRVQIRLLVGAHEEGHNFGVHGIKWKFEPGTPDDPAEVNNTGYRNNQMMGISEHYEFIVPKLPRKYDLTNGHADYLYTPGTSTDDQWNGLWGMMRVYKSNKAEQLAPLPSNLTKDKAFTNQSDFNGVCPKTAVSRPVSVTATTARQALADYSGGTLVYNSREDNGGRLHDPTAIIFFRSEDLDPATGKLRAGLKPEPLILRARAGECLEVTLTNSLPAGTQYDLPGFNTLPMLVENFNANQVRPSSQVGLHPQGVFFDVTRSNGVNVGFNPMQTAVPGKTITYQWYAGDVSPDANAFGVSTPIEFGVTGLTSSDPIKHSNKGAVGALIIEPADASWTEDWQTRAQATVSTPYYGSFREFVMIFQNDINMRYNGFNSMAMERGGIAVPNTAEAEDAEDSGQKAINYRTEPLWKRMGFEPDTPLNSEADNGDLRKPTRDYDFTDVLTNKQIGGLDPETPVFTATVGDQVRMRLVHPAGHARNNVFMVHGHIWEEEPYTDGSTRLGSNPLSEWKGSQYGIGPGSHFDFMLKNGAGGRFAITGDYLYRTFQSMQFDGGMWGLFRVNPQPYNPPPTNCGCYSSGGKYMCLDSMCMQEAY